MVLDDKVNGLFKGADCFARLIGMTKVIAVQNCFKRYQLSYHYRGTAKND